MKNKSSDEHLETKPEYARRVHDEMDRATFEGRGFDKLPERAVVHEVEPYKRTIYREKK